MAKLKKDYFLFQHKFYIKVNGKVLKEQIIHLELFEGINDLINYGSFIINFRNDTLKSLSDYCIGMPVEIGIIETKETINNLVISGISSNVEEAPNLAGALQIYLCNAWLFSKNFNFRSYKGVNSNIVNSILDDRSYKGKRNISVSDNTSKFKYCTLSDLDFIEKIRSEDVSQKKCIYSWISRDGTFNYVNEDFTTKVTSILICDKDFKTTYYDKITTDENNVEKASVGITKSFSIFGNSVDMSDKYLKAAKVLNKSILQDKNGTIIEYSYSGLKQVSAGDDYNLPFKGSMLATTSNTDIALYEDATLDQTIADSVQSQMLSNALCRITFTGTYTNIYAGEYTYLLFLDAEKIEEEYNILSGVWFIESVKTIMSPQTDNLVTSLSMEVSLIRPEIYTKGNNTLNLSS